MTESLPASERAEEVESRLPSSPGARTPFIPNVANLGPVE